MPFIYFQNWLLICFAIQILGTCHRPAPAPVIEHSTFKWPDPLGIVFSSQRFSIEQFDLDNVVHTSRHETPPFDAHWMLCQCSDLLPLTALPLTALLESTWTFSLRPAIVQTGYSLFRMPYQYTAAKLVSKDGILSPDIGSLFLKIIIK